MVLVLVVGGGRDPDLELEEDDMRAMTWVLRD